MTSSSQLFFFQISEFKQYWKALLYEHIQNPALEETFYIRDYIEQLLECDFSPATANPCQDKTENDLADAYVESGYAVVVIDAVYAFAKAVKNLHSAKCGPNTSGICDLMRNELETNFLAAVKAVRYALSNCEIKFIIMIVCTIKIYPLQWRYNERDGISNHQPHVC